MAQIYGFLEKAQLENVSSDLSNTLAGLVWFNTTDSRSKFYDGSAVRVVVDENSTQTLINKILTGNQMASFSPDGVETITAPVVSGEMTINDANQTLTNKIIEGADIRIPSRLDAKQDTRANLETYALTATNGQFVYATDEKRMYEVKDNKLSPVGSGLGSLDFFYAEDFEINQASDLQVTGTITVADETVSPIAGDRSIKVTQVSGSLGAIIKSPASAEGLTLSRNQQNATCGFQGRYEYDGNTGDFDLVAYDETNSRVLGRIKMPKTNGMTPFRVVFNTADTTAEISWYFECKVENIGAILEFDNIEGLVNPLPTVETVTSEHYNDDRGTVEQNTLARLASVSGSGAGYTFTMLADADVDIEFAPFTGSQGLGSYSSTIRVNGNQVAVKHHFCSGSGVGFTADVSLKARLKAGDVVTFTTNIAISSTTLNASFNETSADIAFENDQSSVDSMIRLQSHSGYGSTNTKIPRFSSITSTVGDAITYADSVSDGTSFTVNESGVYSFIFEANYLGGNFQAGFSLNSSQLTSNIADITPTDRLAMNNNTVSTESATVPWTGYLQKGDVVRPHTDGAGAGVAARNSITVSKAAVKPINRVPVTNQVENVFSAKIENNGTASIGSQSSSFIETVNRLSLGTVRITFKPGFFLAEPVTTASIDESGAHNRLAEPIKGGGANYVDVEVRATSGTLFDQDFQIIVQRQGVDYKHPIGYYLGQFGMPMCVLKEVQANGVQGGTFTSGAYQTRTLNTIEGDEDFVSLASNQFTLEPGQYYIKAIAPHKDVNNNKCKIYNITDAADTGIASASVSSNQVGGSYAPAIAEGIINIGAEKVFELQHRCGITKATDGLGAASSYGDNEIYSQVHIIKLR